jgi:hypothetical protein
MERTASVFALPLAMALLGFSPCVGQTVSPPENELAAKPEAAKRFQDHARAEAAAYDIRTESDSGRKLLLRPEPILRWTNPVPEKQMHGEVFLWTDDGRPAAVLCLFEMTETGGVHEYHEFSSLAAGGLLTPGAANRNWSPTMAQLKMSPTEGAPPPATAPRQRLIQMRELAARFTCEKTTRMGETHALRLLSQPVARYESPTHEVSDGALFAFVEATDPEVFLLLEVRSTGGAAQWHFGLARMASVRMQVSFDDKPVWKVEMLPYDGYRNRTDLPYALLFAR